MTIFPWPESIHISLSPFLKSYQWPVSSSWSLHELQLFHAHLTWCWLTDTSCNTWIPSGSILWMRYRVSLTPMGCRQCKFFNSMYHNMHTVDAHSSVFFNIFSQFPPFTLLFLIFSKHINTLLNSIYSQTLNDSVICTMPFIWTQLKLFTFEQ